MKILKFISLFVIIILFTNCVSDKRDIEKRKSIELANSNYKKNMEEYFHPKILFTHFPARINSLPFSLNLDFDDMSIINCYILSNYNYISDIDSLQNSLLKNAVGVYNVLDTNMCVIKENVSKYDMMIDDIVKKRLPTPYFKKEEFYPIDNKITSDMVYSDKTINGLSEDFIVYVLDSKSIYTDSHENLDILKILPTNKKNGYSSGICINKKLKSVLYWTMFF